ncbi:hypothetical protein LCGC14_2658440, partial [marine sediment metagenome]
MTWIAVLALAGAALAGAEGNDAAKRLFEAVRKGDAKKVRALIAESPAAVRAKDRSGNTALHFAAGLDDAEMASLLLAKGADVNAMNTHGSTPLAVAVMAGKTKVVRQLLKHDADPNRKRANADGALNHLARSTHASGPALLQMLVAAGVDVNIRGYPGETPLSSAVRAGNRRMAELLIEAGADVNAAPTQYRPGPLHDARDRATAAMLLDHGARVDGRDFRGRSVLHHVGSPE